MATGNKLPNSGLNLIKTSDVVDVTDINDISDAVETVSTAVNSPSTMTDGVRYTKFPNGLMIVSGLVDVPANETSKVYTFKTPFVYPGWPIISLTNNYTQSSLISWTAVSNYTTMTVYPKMITTGNTPTVSSNCNFVAIGNWK